MPREISRRYHLFEFMDTLLCPKFIRESLTEILGESLRRGEVYDPVSSLFAEFCQKNNYTSIIDLGSGSGGPVLALIEALRKKEVILSKYYLSDLLPNEQAMNKVAERHPDVIDIINVPVDATNIPEEFHHQARTIITAFHHFQPEKAFQILSDSVKKNKAIFIVEPFPRSLKCMLPLIVHSILPILKNPFRAKKNRIPKGICTYFLPLIPVLLLWDGIISVLRIYTEKDLMEMVKPFHNYNWDYYRLPVSFGGTVTVFTGVPI